MTGDVEVVLTLPDRLRAELKTPLGPIYADPERLLARAGEPLVAVGDIVTYHLEAAGVTPAVAIVDGRTEREAVDARIRNAVSDRARRVSARNPPGTLSRELLVAIRDAVGADEETVIAVDGEEDLAALPAILAAPIGASVVYGQPGEGMVLVDVDAETTETAAALLSRMDGDDAVRAILER